MRFVNEYYLDKKHLLILFFFLRFNYSKYPKIDIDFTIHSCLIESEMN